MIGDFIEGNKLVHLDLSSNWIGGDGLSILANVLSTSLSLAFFH
jgi:hypothetical protein